MFIVPISGDGWTSLVIDDHHGSSSACVFFTSYVYLR